MLKEKIRYIKNRKLQHRSESIFEGISGARKKALDNWFKDQWRQIESIEKSLRASVEIEAFEEIVKEASVQYVDFLEVFLLDAEGIVITSSYQAHVGDSYATYPNYIKGLKQERYMYGPYCDKKTLDIPCEQKLFKDEVTLMFSCPFDHNERVYIICVRVLNDDMSNVIQEEDTHVYKESGDNYLFMIQNNRGILPGTAISRSRFEDRTFTLGENLKDGIRSSNGDMVRINDHTEFEIRFTDPATKQLHIGVQSTIDHGENLDCWPGYPDYRHILVGGKGTQIIPPYSDEIWGMMCEGDIAEIYKFSSLARVVPLTMGLITAIISIIAYLAAKHLSSLITGGLYVLIISLVMYLVTRTIIVNPLNRTIKILRHLAEGEGNLTKRVTVGSSNEIGELGRWFNKFISNQMHMIIRVGNAVKLSKNTVTRVTKASKKIESSIHSIEDTIEMLTNNSVTQNELFRNTQDEVMKIAKSFQMNTELETMIKEIESKTASTDQAASTANNVTEQVLSSIDELEYAMKNAIGSISKLDEKSKEITDIVSTISGISSQTNLLALNASIEAARAGKAGKGFAVVAEEIKKLSTETQKATKNIGDLILTVQDEITTTNYNFSVIDDKVKSSVKSTRESTKAVELVVDVSKSISSILSIMQEENKVIVEARNKITEMALESEKSVELGEQSNQIAKNKIGDINKQIDKLKKALEGLEYSSNDLDMIVGAFHISDVDKK